MNIPAQRYVVVLLLHTHTQLKWMRASVWGDGFHGNASGFSKPVGRATMTAVTKKKLENKKKVWRAPQVSVTCTYTTMYLPTPCWEYLVSEPDPLIIEKNGLVNWLGWKCTLHPVWRCTSGWLLSDVRLLEMRTTREPSSRFALI